MYTRVKDGNLWRLREAEPEQAFQQSLIGQGEILEEHRTSPSYELPKKPICLLKHIVTAQSLDWRTSVNNFRATIKYPVQVTFWCKNTDKIRGKFGVYDHCVANNDIRRQDYDHAVIRQLWKRTREKDHYRYKGEFTDCTLLVQSLDVAKDDIIRMNNINRRNGFYTAADLWFVNTVLAAAEVGHQVSFEEIKDLLLHDGQHNGEQVFFEIVLGHENTPDEEAKDLLARFGHELRKYRNASLYQQLLPIIPCVPMEVRGRDDEATLAMLAFGFGYGPMMFLHLASQEEEGFFTVNENVVIQDSVRKFLVEGVLDGYSHDGFRESGLIFTSTGIKAVFQILASYYTVLHTGRFVELPLLFNRACTNMIGDFSEQFIGRYTYGAEAWTGNIEKSLEWHRSAGFLTEISPELVTVYLNKVLCVAMFLDVGLSLAARVELVVHNPLPSMISDWLSRLIYDNLAQEYDHQLISERATLFHDQAANEIIAEYDVSAWVNDTGDISRETVRYNEEFVTRVYVMASEAEYLSPNALQALDPALLQFSEHGDVKSFEEILAELIVTVREICGTNRPSALLFMSSLNYATGNLKYGQDFVRNKPLARKVRFDDVIDQAVEEAVFTVTCGPKDDTLPVKDIDPADFPTLDDICEMTIDEAWGMIQAACATLRPAWLTGTINDFLDETGTRESFDLLEMHATQNGRFKHLAMLYLQVLRLRLAAWNCNVDEDGENVPQCYNDNYRSINFKPGTINRLVKATKSSIRWTLVIKENTFTPVWKGKSGTTCKIVHDRKKMLFILDKVKKSAVVFRNELGAAFQDRLDTAVSMPESVARRREVFTLFHESNRLLRIAQVSRELQDRLLERAGLRIPLVYQYYGLAQDAGRSRRMGARPI